MALCLPQILGILEKLRTYMDGYCSPVKFFESTVSVDIQYDHYLEL